MKKATEMTVLIVLSVIVFPFSLYYLFVFPALVANHTLRLTNLTLAVAALVYFQLWLLVAENAYATAAALYKLPTIKVTIPVFGTLIDRNTRRPVSLFRMV